MQGENNGSAKSLRQKDRAITNHWNAVVWFVVAVFVELLLPPFLEKVRDGRLFFVSKKRETL